MEVYSAILFLSIGISFGVAGTIFWIDHKNKSKRFVCTIKGNIARIEKSINDDIIEVSFGHFYKDIWHIKTRFRITKSGISHYLTQKQAINFKK